MTNVKSLRSRIKTIKSTQKITKAMQMVAAAKLARAKEQTEYTRNFYERVKNVLAAAINNIEAGETKKFLLNSAFLPKQNIIIVISSDRGLCGSFNAILWRKLRAEINSYQNCKVIAIGHKLYENLRNQNIIMHLGSGGSVDDLKRTTIDSLEQLIIEEPATQITIYYMQYKNTLLQVPEQLRLWPLDLQTIPQEKANIEIEGNQLWPQLLKLYLDTNLTLAILESRTGEEAARTTAMDSATRNAGKVISDLTLLMNRTRQAQITNELIEVISGAEAL